MINPLLTWLFVGFVALLAGALLTLLLRGEGATAGLSRFLALLSVLTSSVCFIVVGGNILAFGRVLGPYLLWKPALMTSLVIRVDGLSAFFLIIIGGLSAVATWFAVGYTRSLHGSLRAFYPPYLLFILGMAGVVVVNDFFFFFVPWEFMALASYALVVFHKERPEALKAGFRYFFITHVGTAGVFFGITLLVTRGEGSYRFEAVSRSLTQLLHSEPAVAHFALLLILLGFLVKAGGFPFGMWWLPDAHPAAPSPVSSLLSGVMIKLGLYGILRVFFELMPDGPWMVPWGVLLAAFGVVSLFFGTLAALIQHDAKRLLAYHSIGQVGYMCLGFGMALALAAKSPLIATLALVGGLFHLVNHACFKGLLFLNAGAMEVATGERDLNRLGGLGKLLPITAFCTVIASLSIAGIPLFCGFSSKWMLYHASLWGHGPIAVIFIFFGIVALFISVATLASFLKFMGASIWGTPSPAARAAEGFREGFWLGFPQLVLALLCIGLGVFPHAGAWLSYLVAGQVTAAARLPTFATLFGSSQLSLHVFNGHAVVGLWSPVVVGALLAGAILLAMGIRRLGNAKEREVPVWSCGSVVPAEELRFRAGSYYTPFKKFVHWVLPEWRGEWRPGKSEATAAVLDVDRWAYRPLVRGVMDLFRWFARSHVGIPQVYAAWLVIGFVIAALFLLLS